MNPREYAAMEELEGRQWWYAGMRRITRALLEPRVPATRSLRFLDAGCGTGWNLSDLGGLTNGGRTFGIDISPLATAASRKRGGPSSTVVQGSVLLLPYRDETFDVVTSFDVLYHAWVTDDVLAIQELHRVLKPGGIVLVRVPALKILWGAHDEAVHSRHRYTRGELVERLTTAGFKVERATYANSLLFPVLLTRRFLDRALKRHGSDVEMLPPLLERFFRALLSLEAAGVRFFNWPIGASVFAIARKR